MRTNRKLQVVGILYLAAKIPFGALCYFFQTEILGGSLIRMIAIVLGSLWLLPLVVAVVTIVWVWKAPDFRWLSVIIFVTWLVTVALLESAFWDENIRMGDMGSIG